MKGSNIKRRYQGRIKRVLEECSGRVEEGVGVFVCLLVLIGIDWYDVIFMCVVCLCFYKLIVCCCCCLK